MNLVVILGSGGREHALAMSMLRSEAVSQVLVMPGNPGMTRTENLQIREIKNLGSIAEEVASLQPELVIIGPENYIEQGLADQLRALNIPVFAPSKACARLESSKIFAKDFMNRHGIASARSVAVSSYEEAILALEDWQGEFPPVIKCDELAAGKGVVVAQSMDEARSAIFNFMAREDFTVRAQRLLFEERLVGQEMSLFVLFDGDHYQVLGAACDYKRLNDGHAGPNTGGMGCATPPAFLSSASFDFIKNEIVARVAQGLKRDQLSYQGVLFVGLMVTETKASVVEFNVRFGDPETQVLLPTLEDDLYPYLLACARGELKENSLEPLGTKGAAVHVVMVSAGYPDMEGKGMELGNEIEIKGEIRGVLTYAGVKSGAQGELRNSGGRVLGITTSGESIEEARAKAYQETEKVHFKGAHYRRDIGVFS